eukprot:1371798-Pyramimonas_sp.AAC.1
MAAEFPRDPSCPAWGDSLTTRPHTVTQSRSQSGAQPLRAKTPARVKRTIVLTREFAVACADYVSLAVANVRNDSLRTRFVGAADTLRRHRAAAVTTDECRASPPRCARRRRLATQFAVATQVASTRRLLLGFRGFNVQS